MDDPAALIGSLFVLKSGILWEIGCGMTCWRRLRDWHAVDVWVRLHQRLLNRSAKASRATGRKPRWVQPVCLPWEGVATEPKPTGHGKQSAKRHFVVDRPGILLPGPLAAAQDALRISAGHPSRLLVLCVNLPHLPAPPSFVRCTK